MVFPSALTEHIDLHGLNTDKTFTDCYSGHIGKAYLFAIERRTHADSNIQSCLGEGDQVTRHHAPSNTSDNHRPSTRNTTQALTRPIQGPTTIAWRSVAILVSARGWVFVEFGVVKIALA